MRVLVSGLMNIEINTPIKSFPLSYQPINYHFFDQSINISGVGYNVSLALHTLGAKVIPTTFIGKDLPGQLIMSSLNQSGLNTNFIFKSIEETATSTILYDDEGKRSIFCDLKDLQEQRIDVQLLNDVIEDIDVAILTNINFSRPLLKIAKEKNKPIYVDFHVLKDPDDPYQKEFLMYADVIVLSHEGIIGHEADMILELAKRYNAHLIIVTKGQDGLCYYQRQTKDIKHINAYIQKEVKNTVGAGDAFFSCFTYMYHKHNDVEKSLHYAMLFASQKIKSSDGSKGFISESELIDLMRSHQT